MENLKIDFKIGSAERKFAMLCEDEGEKIKCNALHPLKSYSPYGYDG